MFIDLVDALRCPRPHDETWLVASADRTEGRDIVEGTLGCPVCHAEYPIRRGVVWFAGPGGAGLLDRAPAPPRGDPEVALRLAAFLDLGDAQGFALLAGSWARHAQAVGQIVPVHLVLLNPAPPRDAGRGISVLQAPTAIPLAEATCRGVALDDAHADSAHLTAAVRVLRPRGRLVAPASASTPSGVTELARDDQVWVAERTAAPPKLTTLRGRGG